MALLASSDRKTKQTRESKPSYETDQVSANDRPVFDSGVGRPTGGSKQTPFRGTVLAVETQVVVFPTLSVNGTGSGNATHLGNFTMTYEAEVNLLTRVGNGSIQFIAANGDRVFADFVGQSTPTGTPNVVSIVETGTITGGTGRFAGATGNFVLMRTLNQVTGGTFGFFDGTIVILQRGSNRMSASKHYCCGEKPGSGTIQVQNSPAANRKILF